MGLNWAQIAPGVFQKLEEKKLKFRTYHDDLEIIQCNVV